MKRWPLALGLSLTLISACQLHPNPLPLVTAGEQSLRPVARIVGMAQFPGQWLQALPDEVHTVSLIDPDTGNTLCAGRSNAGGSFNLSPEGTINPPLDSYYYLEVSKRVNQSAIGNDLVSLRTVLRWTATGWSSITNATGGSGEIVVNSTTTAMVLIDHEDQTIGFEELIGKVGGAPLYTAVTPFGSHSAASVAQRADDVLGLLASDTDPLGGKRVAPGNMAPDDKGDPLVHHDYVKAGSTFVWVPVFTAYQLIKPENCGDAHRTKPKGFWVKDRPAGVEDSDWAQETFGGFYAGKYEASRSNASATSAGDGSKLKVAQGIIPWTDVNWDEAALACMNFDRNAHLMRDDEWTALAVWSMIHGIKVHGNNKSRSDVDYSGLTFTKDPKAADRALTGTGRHASWTGTTNLTTHTGKTDGVYDLHGNVYEWTATLGTDLGQYIVDGVKLPLFAPSSAYYIQSLSTDARLRRYGLPDRVGSNGNSNFGPDHFRIDTTMVTKSLRGECSHDGTWAGVWALAFDGERTETADCVGFRPSLRY